MTDSDKLSSWEVVQVRVPMPSTHRDMCLTVAVWEFAAQVSRHKRKILGLGSVGKMDSQRETKGEKKEQGRFAGQYKLVSACTQPSPLS